jgi:hypothetical protein
MTLLAVGNIGKEKGDKQQYPPYREVRNGTSTQNGKLAHLLPFCRDEKAITANDY